MTTDDLNSDHEFSRFITGQCVKDRDGFRGVITKITHHKGSHWYDVRFKDGTRVVGEAVRYENDLTPDNDYPL